VELAPSGKRLVTERRALPARPGSRGRWIRRSARQFEPAGVTSVPRRKVVPSRRPVTSTIAAVDRARGTSRGRPGRSGLLWWCTSP
jgi:hypothetical protein